MDLWKTVLFFPEFNSTDDSSASRAWDALKDIVPGMTSTIGCPLSCFLEHGSSAKQMFHFSRDTLGVSCLGHCALLACQLFDVTVAILVNTTSEHHAAGEEAWKDQLSRQVGAGLPYCIPCVESVLRRQEIDFSTLRMTLEDTVVKFTNRTVALHTLRSYSNSTVPAVGVGPSSSQRKEPAPPSRPKGESKGKSKNVNIVFQKCNERLLYGKADCPAQLNRLNRTTVRRHISTSTSSTTSRPVFAFSHENISGVYSGQNSQRFSPRPLRSLDQRQFTWLDITGKWRDDDTREYINYRKTGRATTTRFFDDSSSPFCSSGDLTTSVATYQTLVGAVFGISKEFHIGEALLDAVEHSHAPQHGSTSIAAEISHRYKPRTESVARRDVVEEHSLYTLRSAAPFLTSQGMASILPPAGSKEREKQLADSGNFIALAVDTFLQREAERKQKKVGHQSKIQFCEDWILFVHPRKRIIITVRPTDCVAMGRLRDSWRDCFALTTMEHFVWCIVEASILNFRQYVEDIHTLLDECAQLMTRRFVERTAAAAQENNPMEASFIGFPHESFGKSFLGRSYFFDRFISGAKSFLRRLKERMVHFYQHLVHRRYSKKDLSIKLMRLYNIVFNQTSSYQKALLETTRLTEHLLVALNGGITDSRFYPLFVRSRTAQRMFKGEKPRQCGLLLNEEHTSLLSSSSLKSSSTSLSLRNASFKRTFQSKQNQDGTKSLGNLATQPGVLSNFLSGVEDTMALGEQFMEKCQSSKSTAASLIDLNNAMTSDFFDRYVSVLTIVDTLFSPLSFLATFYGINFVGMISGPLCMFCRPHAYLINWIGMLLVVILLGVMYRFLVKGRLKS